MAKKTEQPAEPTNPYKERRWMKPSKRAKGYAEERKAKVHKFGKKDNKNSFSNFFDNCQSKTRAYAPVIFSVSQTTQDFISSRKQ